MYPIINIFGREIGAYSLLFIIGIFVCFFVGAYYGKKKYNIMYEDIILIMLAIGAGIILGGHLLYGITNLHHTINAFIVNSPLNLDKIWFILTNAFAGNVFYGGLLGSLAAIFIYTKRSKILVRSQILDLYAFSIPLFHFFGRIGCFLGGCCYGIECKVGFTVYGNDLVPELNGVRRFPVSLLEAILNLLIFATVLYLFRKGKFKGNLIKVYLAFYGVVRFCTEFLRGDEIRGRLLCFSTSQWISICILAFVVIHTLLAKKKNAPGNADTVNK